VAVTFPYQLAGERRVTLRAAMMPGIEIRLRVRDGLASGKLWRLTDDLRDLDGETSGATCHACERSIPRGQGYTVPGQPQRVRPPRVLSLLAPRLRPLRVRAGHVQLMPEADPISRRKSGDL